MISSRLRGTILARNALEGLARTKMHVQKDEGVQIVQLVQKQCFCP